jgi:hypothetical protein
MRMTVTRTITAAKTPPIIAPILILGMVPDPVDGDEKPGTTVIVAVEIELVNENGKAGMTVTTMEGTKATDVVVWPLVTNILLDALVTVKLEVVKLSVAAKLVLASVLASR